MVVPVPGTLVRFQHEQGKTKYMVTGVIKDTPPDKRKQGPYIIEWKNHPTEKTSNPFNFLICGYEISDTNGLSWKRC